MENYNIKFIYQWNKFENAIGVTKVKSSRECIEQDERPKDKSLLRGLINRFGRQNKDNSKQ